jgi:hypothetical protein
VRQSGCGDVETFPLQLPVPGRTGLDGLDEDEEEAAAAAAAASLDDPEDDDVDVGDEDGDDGEENMEADGADEDGDDDLGHPLLQQHLHSGDNSLIDGAMEGVLDPADLVNRRCAEPIIRSSPTSSCCSTTTRTCWLRRPTLAGQRCRSMSVTSTWVPWTQLWKSARFSRTC